MDAFIRSGMQISIIIQYNVLSAELKLRCRLYGRKTILSLANGVIEIFYFRHKILISSNLNVYATNKILTNHSSFTLDSKYKQY